MKRDNIGTRPEGFWGKLDRTDPIQWHSVQDHCADVAACAHSLLSHTLLGDRMARLGGQESLSETQIARLTALAALHDIGKFNHGFQNMSCQERNPDKPDPASKSRHRQFRSLRGRAGHVREVTWMFEPGESKMSSTLGRQMLDALDLRSWAYWAAESRIVDLLLASICHHGKPQLDEDSKFRDARLWEPADGVAPLQGVSNLLQAVRTWLPNAFQKGGEQFTATPEFVHAFSGLVMLADWLGSDAGRFPFAEVANETSRYDESLKRAERLLIDIGADNSKARDSLGERSPEFADLLAGDFSPRGAQAAVGELRIPTEGSVTILESETGSGKTEAALWHFLRLFHAGQVDGMYFALPTRTAATQLYERVVTSMKRVFPDDESRPPVVLAVPGYLSVDGTEGKHLADFKTLWPDDIRSRGWAAEHPKRYLASAIAIGTIDQVLLSSIRVSHAHMRGTALMRSLLVVDEVHASDTYMNCILEQVLKSHIGAGGHAFLMSATLASKARQELFDAAFPKRPKSKELPVDAAIAEPYPRVEIACKTGPSTIPDIQQTDDLDKSVEFVFEDPLEPEQLAQMAKAAAADGAKVIILRNTVSACIATQKALEAVMPANRILSVAGQNVPHHSRYATADRRALDHAVEQAIGKDTRAKGGIVVAATQTIQQSLDLDADLLITDLCPIDVLLQRVGRLHRHARKGERPVGYENARCVVLSPGVDELQSYIRKDGEAYGKNGWGTVYKDLRVLALTDEVLRAQPKRAIPADNRRLVEDVLHPQRLSEFQERRNDAWQRSEIKVHGTRVAERGIAETALLKRDRAYSESAASWDDDEHVKTRLGEGDRRVEFREVVTTPLGGRIKKLDLPEWFFQGAKEEPNEKPVSAKETPDGFEFVASGLTFSYTRLGIQLLDSDVS